MSELTTPLDKIPLIGIFALLIAVSIVAVKAGHLLGRWNVREPGLEKYPIESSMRNSVLGLLTFVLAFAFGVSSNRYGDLRDLAREDTAAIKQVFLACDFLDEPKGDEIRKILREYHTVRLNAVASQDLEKLAVVT